MTTSLLSTIAVELENAAGAATDANLGKAGWWKRIAEAMETVAGATTVANANPTGYMQRTAAAVATLSGHSVTFNKGETGYLTQIVEGLEEYNGEEYTGSLLERFRQAVVGITGDVVGPTLSSPTGVETSHATATLSVTSNEAGGVLRVAVLPSADPAPTETEFDTETTGGDFVDLDTTPVVGANGFTATGLTHTTAYKAHFFQRDGTGNASNIVSSAEFTTEVAPDVTAPVLSDPMGMEMGFDEAHISAVTDEANGTFYGYISESATPPSDEDLIAGTGAVAFDSAIVTATGEQELHITGLDPETEYYGHMLQVDDGDNVSNTVTTAAFTTEAVPSVTAPELTLTSTPGDNPPTFDIDFPGTFILDEDTYEFRHRVDGGAWVNETGQLVDWQWYSDHILDLDPISHPNFNAASFGIGEVVGMQAGITRNADATAWGTEITDTIGGAVVEDPTTWHTSTGTNKHTDVTISGAGLIATGAAGYGGAPISVRGTERRSGDRQFEISGNVEMTVHIGLDSAGTDNFNDSNWSRPGKADANGCNFKFGGYWDREVYSKGVLVVSDSPGNLIPTSGTPWVLVVQWKESAGTVKVLRIVGGVTTEIASITGFDLTDCFPTVAFEGAAGHTTNFGAGQVRDPATDSLVPWDN